MSVRYLSVAPENMPLDVYPDARYLGIADRISPNALISACRVAGTHFHVGMPDWETALEVYNRVVGEIDYLINLGNRTNGERIRIYAGMAKDFMPRTYRSVDDLFDNFCLNGLADNPRGCYHLIRISVHGTIEFRMFDNTDDPDDIDFRGRSCLEVCGDFAKNLAGVRINTPFLIKMGIEKKYKIVIPEEMYEKFTTINNTAELLLMSIKK